MSLGRSSLLVLVSSAAAMFPTTQVQAGHIPVQQAQPQRKPARKEFVIRGSGFRRPGPGWNAAQVKRAARKRRNALRSRGHFRKAVR